MRTEKKRHPIQFSDEEWSKISGVIAEEIYKTRILITPAEYVRRLVKRDIANKEKKQ